MNPLQDQIDRIIERARLEVQAVVLSIQPEPAKLKRDGMMGIGEACEYMKCSETHIRQMVKEGLLPERRVGNRLRFKSDELDRATEVKARLKEAV